MAMIGPISASRFKLYIFLKKNDKRNVKNLVTRLKINVSGYSLPRVGPGSMQSPPPPASSVAQQPFQTPPPPAMGQPQMLPGPQSPHMSPQVSPPQSPQASMAMTGQPMASPQMAGPPMAGMGRPFPGAPPPGLGGFQQPGPGVAGPQGYPQQAGNNDFVCQRSRAHTNQNKYLKRDFKTFFVIWLCSSLVLFLIHSYLHSVWNQWSDEFPAWQTEIETTGAQSIKTF